MSLNRIKQIVAALVIVAAVWNIHVLDAHAAASLESPPARPMSAPHLDLVAPEFNVAGFNQVICGVYLHSGEFHLSATDLRIAGRGLDFAWTRKYRSSIGPNTAMGNGWDFSYNIFIEQSGPDLILHDGNTREDLYVFDPVDNNWVADEFFREFTLDPNPIPFGTYTLTFADKGVWRFHPFDGSPQQGKIVESSDRNNNTLLFLYNGLGQLVTVQDTLHTGGNPREITISYNADGFIESVTDFTGRQVVYEYYPAVASGTLDSWTLHFDTGGPPIVHPIPAGLPIDNGLPPTTSSFIVPDFGPILDLNLELQLTHGDLGELRIELSHLGTTVVLWDGQCAGEADMDVLFDDTGAPVSCVSPVLGATMPFEPLADFNGMDLQGEWTITVTDLAGGDPNGSAGDLKSATTPVVVGTPHGNNFPDGKTTVYTYSTGSPEPSLNGNLLTITDPKGQTFLVNEYAPTLNPLDLEFDRVVRQIVGDPTDIIDIVYTSLVPDPGNNFSVVKATVNDRVGNVSEHFFNGSDQLVIQRDYMGRADPALPTDIDLSVNPPLTPLRADDPALCDPAAPFPAWETRLQWNVDSLPTLIEHPNGNSTQFVYEIDLNPTASQRESGNLRQFHSNAGPLGGDQVTISHFFEYEPGFGNDWVGPTDGILVFDRNLDGEIQADDLFGDTGASPSSSGFLSAGMVDDPFFFDVPAELEFRAMRGGLYSRHSTSGSLGMARAAGGLSGGGIFVDIPDDAVVPFDIPVRVSGLSSGVLHIAPSAGSQGFDTGIEDRFGGDHDLNDNAFRFVAPIQPSPALPDFGSQLVPAIPWESDTFRCVSPPRSPATDTSVPFRIRFGHVIFDSAFVTLHTDGRGNQTQHNYDPNGNRTQTIHRIPSIVEDFEYNAFGQLTLHRGPDNGSGSRREDNFTYYDPGGGCMNGYLKDEIIDAPGFGLTTTYEYDCLGRMTRITDPRGNDSQIEYNALNQPVKAQTREVTGGGTRYEGFTFYDPNDNIIRIDIENKDDQGILQPNDRFSTVYEYDILNYVTRRCQETGSAALGPTDTDCSSMAPSESITTEIEYDANRNPTLLRLGEATNGNQPNNTIRWLYDERDLVFQVTRSPGDADQSTSQVDYDCNGNIRAVRRGLEGPTDIPPADILVTDYVYDGFNRMTRVTDPMGNKTDFHYDPNGNIGGDSAPAMPNPFGVRREGEIIDILGDAGNTRLYETTYEYDPMNRMTRVVTEFFDTETQAPLTDGQSITDIQWSDNSQVRLVTDDNAHQTAATYDTANRLSVIIDPKSNSLTFGYDPNSNIISILETEKSDLLNPDEGFTTTYVYDNLDRVTRITDNVGNANSCGYDSRNNRTLLDDALGNETRYEYDGINRMTRIISDLDGDGADGDGDDIIDIKIWDDTSRLSGLVDDNGNTTTYEYDPLNRMTRLSFADCTENIHTYDVHDNRLTLADANGSLSTCTYDRLNRLETKSIVPGAGVSNDTTFENHHYDGLSRIVRAEDDDTLVTRSYDSLSRVTRETLNIVPPFNPPDDRTTLSAYDGVGNQLTCIYPGGRTITCTYDELDRKKTIADGAGTIATYDYIGPIRVERREYGNGTRTDDQYDGILPNPPGDFGVKRIVRTTHSVIGSGVIIDDRTYIWDPMQNKIQRRDVRAGGPELTHDYVYDSIYRLTRTTASDTIPATVRDTDYDLDGVGNREQVTGVPDLGAYLMDSAMCEPADFQLNQYTRTPFDGRDYDSNGNLVAFGCLIGDFNNDETLDELDVSVLVDVLLGDTFPPCGADVNGDGDANGLDVQAFADRLLGVVPLSRQFSLAYDYRNQMVEFEDASGGQRHTYAYDAMGRRISRIVDADGTSDETRYFYDRWQVVEEQDNVGATEATYVYGLYIDEVLNMQRGGNDFYYHTDDLFNVMAVTDSAGNVVERYEYGDYGTPERQALLQAGDLSAAGGSDDDVFPGPNIVQILAENFSVAEPTTLTGLRWWGGYAVAPAPTDDFTIEIYDDAGVGGAPGALLHQEKAGDVGKTATGSTIVFANLPEHVYQYQLTEPFEIQAGVAYWLVIKNNTTGHPSTWGWEFSGDGDGTVAVMVDGGPWSLDVGDLAVEMFTDGSAIGSPYLFNGRRYDDETGLYYYRTRYLEPRAGRFTTRDPLGAWYDEANLGNGYAFVGNRPNTFVDPLGTQAVTVFGITFQPGQSMGWWGPGGTIIAFVNYGPFRMGGQQWFVFTPAQIATFLSPPGFPFGFLPIPKFPLFCVDESCEVMTPDGSQRLSDIQIGDEVLTPHGDFRKVVGKDFGRVWRERRHDYVKISASKWSVVLTRDHFIAGKPAGEWCDGDTMRLRDGTLIRIHVQPAESNFSGDLQLEGDADYVTQGGFVIGSMMSRYGVSPSRARVCPGE